ncbi:MAG: hypothetical protein LBB98_15460 [Treponema sp.]|jgi:hypothetical protein|nr:hypothetical protein [Treponema sp.]
MQKKRKSNVWKLLLGIMATVMIVFMTTGCPTGSEEPEEEPEFIPEIIPDKVIAGTTHKVKTAVYIEVNDHNPLNAGNYTLADGTLLFDYVILFAANIRNRNCALETNEKHGCTEQGPHVHFNDNVRYILENRQKYIVPLQKKGIKVLLGLLGDHDGIGFGTMNAADRATFIADVKKDVEYYKLDGVDFDDEWASKEDWDGWTNEYAVVSPNSIWTYPTSRWGWPFSGNVYRDPTKGIEPGNGILNPAPSEDQMDAMWKASGVLYHPLITETRSALGPNKIISLYEYNSGRYMTPGGQPNGGLGVAPLNSAISFAMQPWYSQYIENSANGFDRSKYSPFGMDLGGNAYYQGGPPLPPIVVNEDDHATNTIYDFSTRFKKAATDAAPYGMLYFFNLKPASELLKHDSNEAEASVTKQAYISMMTNIVFGQNCVLTTEGEAGDYRKDWGN